MKRSELKKYIRETILNKLDEAAETAIVGDTEELENYEGDAETVMTAKAAAQMNESDKKKS